MDMNSQLG